MSAEEEEYGDDPFTIEMEDGVAIERRMLVDHVEHGPMVVDTITVSPFGRRVKLEGEMGPVGLTLDEEDLHEEWGETLHSDPDELHEPGEMRVEAGGISTEESDIELDITTTGTPARDAERVHLFAVDAAVRAIQAHEQECHPDECEGAEIGFDWEQVHAEVGE